MNHPRMGPMWSIGMDVDVRPNWDDNSVPYCANDDCPSYDGKRCGAMGFRPSTLCEPMVIHMAELLGKRSKG